MAAGHYAAYPIEEATACYEAPDHDSADLCAQWRAAIAAEKAAQAARWANWLSVIGAALTIVGAGFVYLTLKETKRGADAAHAANRPWLDVEIAIDAISVHSQKGYRLQTTLSVSNGGNSPANDIKTHVEGVFLETVGGGMGDWFRHDLRDQSLQRLADRVAREASNSTVRGETVFPGREKPIFVEPVIPWDWSNGVPSCQAAWVVVALEYAFPEGRGTTVKMFVIRSFDLPSETGFDFLANDGMSYTEIAPTIRTWPLHGYAI